MKTKKISPSLLSADFVNLERDIKMLEKGGAHLLHVDVMDGHFVPNITIGPPVVKAIKKVASIPLDVHLMIENPGLYVDDFIKAGSDYVTVHVEAAPHLHRVIQQIKAGGAKAGVSLNPHTSLSTIENVLGDIDMVLIMSVNPGFGGQSFIPQSLDKIRKLKAMLKEHGVEHVEIEIDGGVKLDNIKEVSDAGVDVFVSGSGIFGAADPQDMIQQMIKEIN
ncbi:ribulose-phosphate 3-epimerase [Lentimicrobium sp. S6]|uniref:ribulose-phosphate 3-epimerase n=1 Tax=Lentimicrobium sp. S6 TaxID=2735872 RepID=UPI00155250F0|nr:ribulose-phosphate 3-epimerase [Lentimicrobium sp. S6]NPD44881.1 ribulose-phosphate 3-epimerase [Lentimicrobium sp. S6]